MRKRSFSLIALLAILTTALPLVSATRAQETVGNPSRVQPARTKLPATTLVSDGLKNGGPLAAKSGPTKIVIELNDAPTTQVFAQVKAGGTTAQATIEAQRQLATIQRVQQTLVTSLQSATINATVLYRTQRVYNGIAVQVDAAKLADIQQLPGVKAIRPLISKQIDNSSSVPLIGAPQLWNSSGINKTGDGIKIGVIDTGIDYLHTDFGGSGLTADYSRNNTTIISDNVGFPSAKVVGGYDFAGDDYNADDPATSTPKPDPDPMDCNGHGSHVSGTAAGYGVNADGTTYRGAYGPSTPFSSLRIGPGVAPKASLYALKVFGCEGSTDVTDVAIEWAVDPNGDGDFSDRLDVINMSLGSNYGSGYDSTAVASDNAAAAGVIVVASAGNSGDTYYVTGSPATAGRAISVASSVDAQDVLDGFRINTPPPPVVRPSSNSVAYDFATKPAVTGDLVYPPTQRSGCQPFDNANKALLAGKVALLDWTETAPGTPECGSAKRTNNAADAGAIGVIFAFNRPFLDTAITGSPRIPATITAGKSVSDELKAKLAAGTVNVTLTGEYNSSQKFIDASRNDTLSNFSSRGPRRGDSALKPDISAPGQTIFSVAAGSGNQGVSFNGTSMASPHVAGSMALLRQLYPDWTVEELKALAMNTANNDVRSDIPTNSPLYGPARVGAGRITLQDAATDQVIAYNANDPGLVSVSFGAPEVVGETTATKNIRIVNKSSQSVTYNVAYRGITDVPGVSYSLSRTSVTLAPYGFANVAVTMTANAAAMKHTRDVTVSPEQSIARAWLSEASGYVTLTPSSSGAPDLRVPVYAAPRPASDMRAKTTTLDFGTSRTGSKDIELVGQGVNTGPNYPTDTLSLVSAYELQTSSPNDASSAGIVDNADLKYVGIASDVKASSGADSPKGDITKATLQFGVATYGKWSTPNEAEFDIYIDTNRDGEDDYVLFNTNLASATGGANPSDVFVTVLVNLNAAANDPKRVQLEDFINGVAPSDLDTQAFNTTVMGLPVAAADLGLTSANASFNYYVASFSRDANGVIDQTPVMTYNAAQPGLDLSGNTAGAPLYEDLPGDTIPVNFTLGSYKSARSQGVLLLHHQNTTDRQAEVVRVNADFPFKLWLPLFMNGKR